MKLSEWAKKNGVTYQTAWRYHKQGNMPSGFTTTQLPNGTILVVDELVGVGRLSLVQRVENLEVEVEKLKGGQNG